MALKVEHEVYQKAFATLQMYDRLSISRIHEIEKMEVIIKKFKNEIRNNNRIQNNKAQEELIDKIDEILKRISITINEIENWCYAIN